MMDSFQKVSAIMIFLIEMLKETLKFYPPSWCTMTLFSRSQALTIRAGGNWSRLVVILIGLSSLLRKTYGDR